MAIANKPTRFAALVTLALAATGPARAAGLVNGDFETGSLSGWTQTGNTNFTGVTSMLPRSGSYDAFFGNPGSNTAIAQTITFTSGTRLTVGGYLASEGTQVVANGEPTNLFEIDFNGTPIFSTIITQNQPYTLESGTAVATGSDVVSFVFRNDRGLFRFDDASVTVAVPEPSTALLLGTGLLGALAFRIRSARLSKQRASA